MSNARGPARDEPWYLRTQETIAAKIKALTGKRLPREISRTRKPPPTSTQQIEANEDRIIETIAGLIARKDVTDARAVRKQLYGKD